VTRNSLVCSPDVPVVDLRHQQVDPAPKTKHVRGRTQRRPPEQVIGVCIHQMAARFTAGAARIRQAKGDEALALHRRALEQAYHAIAFRRTMSVAMGQRLVSYTHHGGFLNRKTLGFAVDGLYAGLKDDPDTDIREDVRTTWGGEEPDQFRGQIVEVARAGLARLVEEGRQAGVPIRYVWAHRQASANRRADPGEAIWRRLVLEWAVPVLGLETQPERTWGTGRPIPRDWDPAGVGPY
jgi:hypothetical protein